MPFTNLCCSCESEELCFLVLGCNGIPVPGITIHVDPVNGTAVDIVTDENGRACHTPDATGETIWSFDGNSVFDPASGSFNNDGRPREITVALVVTPPNVCSCTACGPYPLPPALTGTSEKWGETTLYLSSCGGGYQNCYIGFLSASGPDCDGTGSHPSIIMVTLLCDGGGFRVQYAVAPKCCVIDIGYSAYFRFTSGTPDPMGQGLMSVSNLIPDVDCLAIDITVSIQPPAGDTLPRMILSSCDTSLSVMNAGDYALTLGAWAFWTDVLTITP
jgi:hypothetical protein